MDFPSICLPWHFLSPQKTTASSASCSRAFQWWGGSAQRSPCSVSKPSTSHFQQTRPHSFYLENTVKNGFLVTSCVLYSFLLLSSPQKYFFFFFFSLNQFQLPETVVLLWLHHFMELSVEFLFSEVQQSLNNANLGFECFPIWACSLRCHRFHFLYNLLREGCLKFLSSLELVVASVFVGVVFFFFVWLFTNHVMWRT